MQSIQYHVFDIFWHTYKMLIRCNKIWYYICWLYIYTYIYIYIYRVSLINNLHQNTPHNFDHGLRGKMRSDHIRPGGVVRSGQIRSGQVRSGQVRSGQYVVQYRLDVGILADVTRVERRVSST